jgi:hypothetical protein
VHVPGVTAPAPLTVAPGIVPPVKLRLVAPPVSEAGAIAPHVVYVTVPPAAVMLASVSVIAALVSVEVFVLLSTSVIVEVAPGAIVLGVNDSVTDGTAGFTVRFAVADVPATSVVVRTPVVLGSVPGVFDFTP